MIKPQSIYINKTPGHAGIDMETVMQASHRQRSRIAPITMPCNSRTYSKPTRCMRAAQHGLQSCMGSKSQELSELSQYGTQLLPIQPLLSQLQKAVSKACCQQQAEMLAASKLMGRLCTLCRKNLSPNMQHRKCHSTCPETAPESVHCLPD